MEKWLFTTTGPARRRPLLHPHRRRRRPERRLRARLRQRRRRAPGERGRRRRLPRARAPRRQGAGRPVRRRVAARDRRLARHRHPERARVAPLHLRRLRREGRRLAVGAQHARHQGPGVAAAERRARRVRARQRPRRAAVPAHDGQHRQRRLHDPRAGLGPARAGAGALRLPARQGHRRGVAAGLGDGPVRPPRPRDRRRPPGRDPARRGASATRRARSASVPALALTAPAGRRRSPTRARPPCAARPTPRRCIVGVGGDVVDRVTPADGAFEATGAARARRQPDHRGRAWAPTAAPPCARSTVVSFGTRVGGLTDPAGDDNGPGTYVYPTNSAFAPGGFDLTALDVFTDGDQVVFVATHRRRGPQPVGRRPDLAPADQRLPRRGRRAIRAGAARHQPGHRRRRGAPSWSATAASTPPALFGPDGGRLADGRSLLAVPETRQIAVVVPRAGARRARPRDGPLRRRDVRQRRGRRGHRLHPARLRLRLLEQPAERHAAGSRSTASAAARA